MMICMFLKVNPATALFGVSVLDSISHTCAFILCRPGHVKSSLMGASLNVPIKNGRLALGTWQGIYLCEHRDTGGWGGGHTRRIVITLQGTS
jgi:secondary thiamine-phosphate synthase enzyme